MSRPTLKFLRNEVIEEATACRIRQYETKAGVTVTFPVPIDKIVEQVLGLDFDWDEIEEGPGEQILGGLHVASRKIYLNTKHIRSSRRIRGWSGARSATRRAIGTSTSTGRTWPTPLSTASTWPRTSSTATVATRTC